MPDPRFHPVFHPPSLFSRAPSVPSVALVRSVAERGRVMDVRGTTASRSVDVVATARRPRWRAPAVVGSAAFLLGLGVGNAGDGVSAEDVLGSAEYRALVVERDSAEAAASEATDEVRDAVAAQEKAEAAASAAADRLASQADLETREAAVAARAAELDTRASELDTREDALARTEQQQTADAPAPVAPVADTGLDPRFGTCKEAKAHGYGSYVVGVDPEYDWYRDADGDGIVCE